MTNKIVILDDSVLLYEHYINDYQWERTLAFPRGGLTYLISNGTLVRDFVPCTRDSDSKAGMYDIVNNVFYSSANSYNFVAGNQV